MQKPLIILTGPTAAGKTGLSIKLAKSLNAEIISADSMQVYKGMDIGSAKIMPEEMEGVKHYLIDEYEITDDFNVVEFSRAAKAALDEIYAKGKIPIIVGGTGFYIQAVLRDIDFTETGEDEAYRQSLYDYASEYGAEALHNKLKELDPDAAAAIHPNNIKRVARAIEFANQTGSKISEHNEKERAKKSPYNFAYFVLTRERSELYERIDKRVDMMIEAGLVDEVKRLKDMGANKDMVSMQGLGYKEILSYLDGECSLDEAIYLIKRDTRHFAKRQLTWFRRESDVIYLEADKKSEDELLSDVINVLQDKNII